jgi:hypothetical protein
MVAGRCLWGEDEHRAAEHQAGRGGDLGVEAVVEDGSGAGEARGLGASVETGRQVDQKDDREAEQTEDEDDAAETPPSRVAHRQHCQCRGKQRHRQQQVSVRLARRLGGDRWRGGRQEARVAGLPDLDGAVLDELGDCEAGGGSDDHGANRPLWGQHGAGPRRGPDRQVAAPEQTPFEP